MPSAERRYHRRIAARGADPSAAVLSVVYPAAACRSHFAAADAHTGIAVGSAMHPRMKRARTCLPKPAAVSTSVSRIVAVVVRKAAAAAFAAYWHTIKVRMQLLEAQQHSLLGA